MALSGAASALRAGLCPLLSAADVLKCPTPAALAARIQELNGTARKSPVTTERVTSPWDFRASMEQAAEAAAERQRPPPFVLPAELGAAGPLSPEGTPLAWPVQWVLQLCALAVMLTVRGLPLLPTLYILTHTINHYGADAGRVGLAVFLAVVFYGLVLVVAAVALKWTVVGRLRPGAYRMWSLPMLRWWFGDQLTHALVTPVAMFLRGSSLLSWWYRAFGADIGAGVIIDSVSIR